MSRTLIHIRLEAYAVVLLAVVFMVLLSSRPQAAEVPAEVLAAEKARIAVIAKVKPAVAAVCFYGGKGCGSGVIISPDGYCLTNFHVVQPTGPIMQCGLADGKLYDSVLVGTDKVGDVALVKLLPRKPGTPFPYVKLGDSDKVRAGDWSLAMGNPFSLAIDFNPTVTYGLVSGTNRYQPPEGKGTLEYTDCIQIDTSINPGNSGGPLFNMDGELIGINGRGSFEKRGRVNSGVGYAISINQIKNFLGALKAGLDTDHATLGALVTTQEEDGDLSRIVVDQILEESDAFRRGLKEYDQIVSFAGRPMTSTNQYKNVLGIYPKGWRLPIAYRREIQKKQMLVRLMGNIDTPVETPNQPPAPPRPRPGQPRPGQPVDPNAAKAKASPAAKMYESKKGFANFYFNELEQKDLIERFKKNGDFTAMTGDWTLDGTVALADRSNNLKISWLEDKEGFTQVVFSRDGVTDEVKPLSPTTGQAELFLPQGSGGLLTALYQYRLLLTKLQDGFSTTQETIPKFIHGGIEPVYVPRLDGKAPESLADLRVDCEVLKTSKGPFETKWYFSQKDATLIGCEAQIMKNEDPCELFFADYKDVQGMKLPHRIEVWYGDKRYAILTIRTYTLAKKAS